MNDSTSMSHRDQVAAESQSGAPEPNHASSALASVSSEAGHPAPVAIQRLHLATLWLPWLDTVVGTIIPVFIACLFMPLGTVIYFVVLFGLLPTAIYHALNYLAFRYQLTDTEFVLRSGVFFRRERRIPLDRIQELAIHQTIFHRLFDLAKVEITTAGGEGREATLNVVTREAADDLKRRISERRTPAEPNSAVLATPPEFSCTLSNRDLLVGGLTSKIVASLGALIAAVAYFQLFIGMSERWWGGVEQKFDHVVDDQLPRGGGITDLFGWLESKIPDLGPLNFLVDLFFSDTLPKSLTLVALGLGGSILAYVFRYHGFQLERKHSVINTSHGLLTTRRNSLPCSRIQTLKLEEGLLRRYFGLASIRVDSAGDRKQVDEAKNRDVLLPVAKRDVAHRVAREAMPGLTNLSPTWHGISPMAISRGSKKGWLLVAVAMLQTYFLANWVCLLWLPAFPLVYVLNRQWYRNTGYFIDDGHFLSRKGWINRSTMCLPLKNIQNIAVSQSFFDRRLQLGTLSIDTAGQSNTGGGPVLRHLPIQTARQIQRALSREAAASEFVW